MNRPLAKKVWVSFFHWKQNTSGGKMLASSMLNWIYIYILRYQVKIFIYSLMNFDLHCSRHHIQTIAHVHLLLLLSIKTLIPLVSFHLQCGENISYLSDPEITSCIFWRVLFITSFFFKKKKWLWKYDTTNFEYLSK